MASTDTDTTTIVIVFVSFGGVFFLAFLAVALCCFIKKMKKNKKVQETEVVDEHLKVKEAIVEGPHGGKAEVLSIEDDVHVHIQEEMKKNERFSHGLQAKTADIESAGYDDHEVGFGASSSGSSTHHHLHHKA